MERFLAGSRAALVVALLGAATGAAAQDIGRGEAADVLAEALRWVAEDHYGGRYPAPILTGLGVSEGVARGMGGDTVGLGGVVSEALGMPFGSYGEGAWCDTERERPARRAPSDGLRLSGTVMSVTSEGAEVAVGITAGPILGGHTVRMLRLTRGADGWSVLGFRDGALHGDGPPCAPPAPVSTPRAATAFAAAIVDALDSPPEGLALDVVVVCPWYPRGGWIEVVDAELRSLLAARGVRIGDDCARFVEGELVVRAPDDLPAVIARIHSLVPGDEPGFLTARVGYLTGDPDSRCGRSLQAFCYVEHTLAPLAEGWAVVSRRIAPFTRRPRGEGREPSGEIPADPSDRVGKRFGPTPG